MRLSLWMKVGKGIEYPFTGSERFIKKENLSGSDRNDEGQDGIGKGINSSNSKLHRTLAPYYPHVVITKVPPSELNLLGHLLTVHIAYMAVNFHG